MRDRWIGWDFRSQYGRLKLIANNSRFLIRPPGRRPNVGSRVLSLLERWIAADWQARYGHPVFLLETFVDPRRFHGGVYRASNWIELGMTQGYRRRYAGGRRADYSATADAPKRVFVRPLRRDARTRLTDDPTRLCLTGTPKIMLNAEQMRQPPQCFATAIDPRRPSEFVISLSPRVGQVFLTDRTGIHREENRRVPRRNCAGDHQPHAARSLATTGSGRASATASSR